MREKIKVIFAWALFVLIAIALTAGMIYYFSVSPTGIAPTTFQILFAGAPVVFAFIGALIISRQPRNVIGLLMMIPGLALTIVTDAYLQPLQDALPTLPQ